MAAPHPLVGHTVPKGITLRELPQKAVGDEGMCPQMKSFDSAELFGPGRRVVLFSVSPTQTTRDVFGITLFHCNAECHPIGWYRYPQRFLPLVMESIYQTLSRARR